MYLVYGEFIQGHFKKKKCPYYLGSAMYVIIKVNCFNMIKE